MPERLRKWNGLRFMLLVASVLVVYIWLLASAAWGARGLRVGDSPAITATLFCPRATREPFWVDPVTSPTHLLTQTITVWIGNGEFVSVTARSGTFNVTGAFNTYNHPAGVTMTLLSNTTHSLTVSATVRTSNEGGCIYGGYTLSTTGDRNGLPLTIVQLGGKSVYLPILLVNTQP